MAQVKIGDAHGLYRIFVGLVNDSGYNYGTAGPDAAEGTLLSPYMVRYGQNAALEMPDRTVINFTGGDIWTGSYVYGITELGTFQMTLSTVEADLIAFTSGSLVDQTTNSQWTIYAENIMMPTPPQCCIMITFRLQSKQPGSKGANKYIHMWAPRVWVAPKGISGAPAFQQPGTYGFTVIPTVGDRMPWGPAFGDNQSWEENESPAFYLISDYPMHSVGYLAEAGASETVTLPYKPISFDYSSPNSSTQPVQVVVDGTITNATSINRDTGAVVVPGPFTGGEYIGILYETIFEATS